MVFRILPPLLKAKASSEGPSLNRALPRYPPLLRFHSQSQLPAHSDSPRHNEPDARPLFIDGAGTGNPRSLHGGYSGNEPFGSRPEPGACLIALILHLPRGEVPEGKAGGSASS